MTEAVTVSPTRVFADVLVRRTAAADTALVVAGVALVAISARVQVPLWPVPITMQTLAVLLVGAGLGARRAAVSLSAYAALGLVGLPLFAAGGGYGYLARPDFGYIIGFIPAAALAGWLAERQWDTRSTKAMLAFLGASAMPFVFGIPYLAVVLAKAGLPHDPATILTAGLLPFVVGGIVKAAIAAVTMPTLWRVAGSRRHE